MLISTFKNIWWIELVNTFNWSSVLDSWNAPPRHCSNGSNGGSMVSCWQLWSDSNLSRAQYFYAFFTFIREALHIFYPTNVRGDRLFMVSLFFRYVAPALHCISSESEIHPPLKSKSFDISLHFFSKEDYRCWCEPFFGRCKQWDMWRPLRRWYLRCPPTDPTVRIRIK